MNHENSFHVIKDPVHGTMQFTTVQNNWIKPFIDSAPFQRLRHIKQMGMGDFIFPGAVHTRFNHCLGCCYTASRISEKIGLKNEDAQLVLIACLLHDIGHGPFSHTFEDLFLDKCIRHELWTPFFLAEFKTSKFFAHYNKINPKHPLTEEKFLLIENMIMHRDSHKPLLADIVSSQLDADRLDYLLRDSHFCGVTYGEFDFRWMLNSMAIVEGRLGLTHKGIGIVEHYLMARRLMIRNIYHHQKKLAFEYFLIQLLSYLAKNLSEHKIYSDIKQSRLGHFLLQVNQFNQQIITEKNPDVFKQKFLKENYDTYKELRDYDVFALIHQLTSLTKDTPAKEIATRLSQRQMPKIIRLAQNDIELIENELAHFKKSKRKHISDWQLALIKTPHQSYTIKEDPILVINENGAVKPLDEISLMIHAMGDQFEHAAFICVDKMIYEDHAVRDFIKHLSRDNSYA